MEGRPGCSSRVKLLVDEMYAPVVAEQLRSRGHEAVAVQEVAGGPGMSDADLLRWAHDNGRAVVTENVVDFLALHAAALQSGERHSGVVFASNATFPRGKASTVGALVKALDRLLTATAMLDTDVCWLP
jgi:predicted nuclease of predicted toxin-antitoxin system